MRSLSIAELKCDMVLRQAVRGAAAALSGCAAIWKEAILVLKIRPHFPGVYRGQSGIQEHAPTYILSATTDISLDGMPPSQIAVLQPF